MSKIYIVTTGEYSEYHIEAVFIDPESAEKFCAVRSGVDRDIPLIEEWDISDKTSVECEKVYKAIFFTMYNNGRIHSVSMIYSTDPITLDIRKNRSKDYRNLPCDIKGISGYIPVNESVNDYDAAKKIIYDHIAKWKAEQVGL